MYLKQYGGYDDPKLQQKIICGGIESRQINKRQIVIKTVQ